MATVKYGLFDHNNGAVTEQYGTLFNSMVAKNTSHDSIGAMSIMTFYRIYTRRRFSTILDLFLHRIAGYKFNFQ